MSLRVLTARIVLARFARRTGRSHECDRWCVPLAIGGDPARRIHTPTVLPFNNLRAPWDVAVDRNGTVYVADHGNHRVVALSAP